MFVFDDLFATGIFMIICGNYYVFLLSKLKVHSELLLVSITPGMYRSSYLKGHGHDHVMLKNQ